jgi:osmotically-inducible protein OsmY
MKTAGWMVMFGLVSMSYVAAAENATDKSITQQVQTLIVQHPDLGTTLYVRTINGVVYLTGTVSTSYGKSNAESLAQSVVGVRSVIDNLGISK